MNICRVNTVHDSLMLNEYESRTRDDKAKKGWRKEWVEDEKRENISCNNFIFVICNIRIIKYTRTEIKDLVEQE